MPFKDSKQKKSDEEEVSLSSFLSALRHDDQLSDLIIEGSDGEKIRTNKCILASRSDVFRAMLFGKFSEAQGDSSVVRVGYDGRILNAVVDYCYTNNARLFENGPYDEGWARTMVQLSAAADYFELPSLGQKVFDLTCSKMLQEPALACSVFDEAEAVSDVARILATFALRVIRSNAQEALLPDNSKNLRGVAALRQTALSKILKDSRIEADEFSLFRALQKWSDCGHDDEVCAGAGSGLCMSDQGSLCGKKRKEIAAEQAKCIQLKRIKASDLCSTVIPSGLVEPDRVAEAFKAQALLLENTIPMHRLPRWDASDSAHFMCESTCSATSALLLCEPIVSGISTWTIHVESLYSSRDWVDEIGIVHSSIKCGEDGLATGENKSWVLDSHGTAWCGENECRSAGERVPFTDGSKIIFSLDLTGKGSLTAAVDENDPKTLFDNILGEFEDGVKPSLRPAVALKDGASVRFLGFHGNNS